MRLNSTLVSGDCSVKTLALLLVYCACALHLQSAHLASASSADNNNNDNNIKQRGHKLTKRFAIATVLNPSSIVNANNVVLFPGPRRSAAGISRYASSASFLVPFAIRSNEQNHHKHNQPIISKRSATVDSPTTAITTRTADEQQQYQQASNARRFLLEQTASLLAAASARHQQQQQQLSRREPASFRAHRQLDTYDRPAMMSPLVSLQQFGAKRGAKSQEQLASATQQQAVNTHREQVELATNIDEPAADTRRYSQFSAVSEQAPSRARDEDSASSSGDTFSSSSPPQTYTEAANAVDEQRAPQTSNTNNNYNFNADNSHRQQNAVRLVSAANNNRARYESPDQPYNSNNHNHGYHHRSLAASARQQQQQHRANLPTSDDYSNSNQNLNSNLNQNSNANNDEQASAESQELKKPDRLALLLQRSQFSCANKKDGYYADNSVQCQAFHYCVAGAKHSWQCPEGTVFHQVHLNCVPSSQDICDQTERYHMVNEYLYKPMDQNGPNQTVRYHQRYYPEEFTVGMPSAGVTFENVAGENPQAESQDQPQPQQQAPPAPPTSQLHPSSNQPAPLSAYGLATDSSFSSSQNARYAPSKPNVHNSSPHTQSSNAYSNQNRPANVSPIYSHHKPSPSHSSRYEAPAAIPVSYSRYAAPSSASRSSPSVRQYNDEPHLQSAAYHHQPSPPPPPPQPAYSSNEPASVAPQSNQYSDSEPDYRSVPSASAYSGAPDTATSALEPPAYSSQVRPTSQRLYGSSTSSSSSPSSSLPSSPGVSSSYQRAIEPIRGVARTLTDAAASSSQQVAAGLEALLYNSANGQVASDGPESSNQQPRASADGIPLYGRGVATLKRREVARNYKVSQLLASQRAAQPQTESDKYGLIRDAFGLQVAASSADELQMTPPMLKVVPLISNATNTTLNTELSKAIVALPTATTTTIAPTTIATTAALIPTRKPSETAVGRRLAREIQRKLKIN